MDLHPDHPMGAFVWGVFSGLATAAIIYVCTMLYNGVIVPWHQKMRYDSFKVDGKWTYRQSIGDKTWKYSMVLIQTAVKLSGTATIVRLSPAPGEAGDYTEHFIIEGSIHGEFLTVNLKTSDKNRLSFATSLLKVKQNGQSLVGHMSYRSHDTGEIGTEEITWKQG